MTSSSLAPNHTAIMLHWPHESHQSDITFIYPSILPSSHIHSLLDVLIPEHLPTHTAIQGNITTEISIFWHDASGHWDLEELTSHSNYPPACR